MVFSPDYSEVFYLCPTVISRGLLEWVLRGVLVSCIQDYTDWCNGEVFLPHLGSVLLRELGSFVSRNREVKLKSERRDVALSRLTFT